MKTRIFGTLASIFFGNSPEQESGRTPGNRRFCNPEGIVSFSPGLSRTAGSYPGFRGATVSTPTGLCRTSTSELQSRWGSLTLRSRGTWKYEKRRLPRGSQHGLHSKSDELLPLPFGRGEGRGEGLLVVVYPTDPSVTIRRCGLKVRMAVTTLAALASLSGQVSIAGHAFGGPQSIGPSIRFQVLALDGNGTAHLVYPDSDALLYRSIPRGGSISAPRTLVSSGIGFSGSGLLDMAADSGSLLHLVWRSITNGVSTLFYATQPGDGPLDAPVILDQTTVSNQWNVDGPLWGARLRIEPNGRAQVVWKFEKADFEQLKHVAISNGVAGGIAVVAQSAIAQFSGPQIYPGDFGVDAAGAAHVAYGVSQAMELRTVNPDGGLAAPVALGQENNDEITGELTQALVAGDGTTHVLWIVYDNNQSGAVLYSLVGPDGTLLLDRSPILATQYFTPPARGALDSRGRLHVLAKIGPPTPGGTSQQLNYSIYRNGRQQSARTIFSGGGYLSDYFITIGLADKPTLVWSFAPAGTTLGDDVFALRPGDSRPRNISLNAPSADDVKALATNSADDAFVLWTAFDHDRPAADYFSFAYGN